MLYKDHLTNNYNNQCYLLYHPTNIIPYWHIKVLSETSGQIWIILTELSQIVIPLQLSNDVTRLERLGIHWHSELILELLSHEVTQLLVLPFQHSIVPFIA